MAKTLPPDIGLVDDLTKEFLAESQDGLDRMERCLTELEVRPGDQELVGEIFRAVHTIKGATGFLGFHRLEAISHAGEQLLGAVRDGTVAATSEVVSGLLELLDSLREVLRLIETVGDEGSRTTDDDASLLASLEELAIQGTSAKLNKAVPVAAQGSAMRAPAGITTAGMNDKTLRVDVEVLNRMMNLVGELVLTRNQMLQGSVGAGNFQHLAERLDSVTADLRETVMQARMQPVGYLFGKFPRMVRDLARTCGRKVRVEFSGQETGLDKSLLEAIKDPLAHAVRNAVDHGIEEPAERLKAGKEAEGVVLLRAFQASGSVVIEVSDDGAGIDVARVLAKAVEKRLVTPEQVASMSQREALQMIFLPGFSTAKQVTTISGRGVGMDVVRANVEMVGGSVEVESHPGKGTTLRMRVPLTLAIVPALVVRSGGQAFAVPQSALVELVYVPRRDAAAAIERIGRAELYRLRERLLPMVWLDRLLRLERVKVDEAQGFYLAVLEAEGCRYGLVVDDVVAPEEIVVKPLSAVLREIGLFSGATVLGNGKLALILDVPALAARAGVRPTPEMDLTLRAGPTEACAEQDRPLLVFEILGRDGASNSAEKKAIPLDAVERIESVALSRVEYAGGRALLQYRGELLPLEDESHVLQRMRLQAGGGGDARTLTVLICRRPGEGTLQRMGIVVERVLDVSRGTMLARDEGLCVAQLAMVKDAVTAVHKGFEEMAMAGWEAMA